MWVPHIKEMELSQSARAHKDYALQFSFLNPQYSILRKVERRYGKNVLICAQKDIILIALKKIKLYIKYKKLDY